MTLTSYKQLLSSTNLVVGMSRSSLDQQIEKTKIRGRQGPADQEPGMMPPARSVSSLLSGL